MKKIFIFVLLLSSLFATNLFAETTCPHPTSVYLDGSKCIVPGGWTLKEGTCPQSDTWKSYFKTVIYSLEFPYTKITCSYGHTDHKYADDFFVLEAISHNINRPVGYNPILSLWSVTADWRGAKYQCKALLYSCTFPDIT
jgi:hypothetical protein